MAEEMAVFETLLLPCTDNEIEQALVNLRLHDNAAKQELIANCIAVANYACANQDTLVTLDVNPVMLTKDGQALATDALIEKQM